MGPRRAAAILRQASFVERANRGLVRGTLHDIYARTQPDAASRYALAWKVVAALRQSSKQSAALAATKAAAIQQLVVPGASRTDAFAILKSKGLDATDRNSVPGAVHESNPDLFVRIPSAFDDNCEWSSIITVHFTRNDRVEGVRVEPLGTCS